MYAPFLIRYGWQVQFRGNHAVWWQEFGVNFSVRTFIRPKNNVSSTVNFVLTPVPISWANKKRKLQKLVHATSKSYSTKKFWNPCKLTVALNFNFRGLPVFTKQFQWHCGMPLIKTHITYRQESARHNGQPARLVFMALDIRQCTSAITDRVVIWRRVKHKL